MPLLTVFENFLAKNGVNLGHCGWVKYVTTCPPATLISIRHGAGEQTVCSKGRRSEFGGTGGARSRILCPAKVNQIDTVFDQKVPPLGWALGGRFCPGGSIPPDKNRTLGLNIEVGGSKVPARFPKSVFFLGGALSPQ